MVTKEPGDEWTEGGRRFHLENQERTRAAFAREFGADYLDKKIENFVAFKYKQFLLLSIIITFFEQARSAFVIGACYPALVSACALDERILNHLVLDLRSFYKNTPEYKRVYRKNSFENWEIPIDTLEAWNVLLPKAAAEFRALKMLRRRSIHFNVSTCQPVDEIGLA